MVNSDYNIVFRSIDRWAPVGVGSLSRYRIPGWKIEMVAGQFVNGLDSLFSLICFSHHKIGHILNLFKGCCLIKYTFNFITLISRHIIYLFAFSGFYCIWKYHRE